MCTRLIQRGIMTESRPCLRTDKHIERNCVPDLTGLIFGLLKVLGNKKAEQQQERTITTWEVENIKNGKIYRASANNLVKGRHTGRNHGYAMLNGKELPEYRTVYSHRNWIFKSQDPHYHVYKGMPFYPDWNPDEGGAIWRGARWIIENLGSKPGPQWSIDIIEHAKGFWPGNLRWALKHAQTQNQTRKKLGSFTLQELEVEAKRHGYQLVPIKDNYNGNVGSR